MEALAQYGAYAFGVIMFLIIWKAVIEPQLKISSVQNATLITAVESLQTLVSTQSQMSLAQTKALETIVQSMDTLVDRMTELKHERSTS
ncbi:MAG: hypothetical protein AB7V18_19400 [Pyrinomonadaceae bacterium]